MRRDLDKWHEQDTGTVMLHKGDKRALCYHYILLDSHNVQPPRCSRATPAELAVQPHQQEEED